MRDSLGQIAQHLVAHPRQQVQTPGVADGANGDGIEELRELLEQAPGPWWIADVQVERRAEEGDESLSRREEGGLDRLLRVPGGRLVQHIEGAQGMRAGLAVPQPALVGERVDLRGLRGFGPEARQGVGEEPQPRVGRLGLEESRP